MGTLFSVMHPYVTAADVIAPSVGQNQLVYSLPCSLPRKQSLSHKRQLKSA